MRRLMDSPSGATASPAEPAQTHQQAMAELFAEREALINQRYYLAVQLWANRTQIDLLLSEPATPTGAA